MKKVILMAFVAIVLASCGGNGKTANEGSKNASVEDANLVNVYYFHGKQRCKTCIAVGNVTKETVETAYANNSNVKFAEILTTEKEYENLFEKYEVSWNALIIAKGDDFVDITEQAFATAVNNPESLTNLIKDEVNKRIN
ncbi:nitrophenyl compound nitroreductase subunit ArsF family protein [Bacteroidales bacterium OttesenSCG-928-L19]|nr:nitrophenyl compound nitroreductase subunit ArsF family protein [Bacteroidales bacterium OttesenSCG-928-L19]